MKRVLVLCLLTAILSLNSPAGASAEWDGSKAFTKASRGVINILTGWVEIPKRVQETTQFSGPASGLTWGILRGIGYTFFRTAAGAYELITFPFPAPPDYAPVIEPEYVFSAETSTSTSSY